MHRLALLVALVGCKCNEKAAPKPQASGSAVAIDAGVKKLDDAAIAARFNEFRDDRALACMLEKTSKPNTMSPVLDHVAEYSTPMVTRVVAFALVERAKPEGESVELYAIAEAVDQLGALGDVEGLKTLFARVDEIQGVRPNWLDYDETYRARVMRDLPAKVRDRAQLQWVTQTAMGGDLGAATAIYDMEVRAEDRKPSADHVAALVALGRDAKAKELVDQAPAKDRPQLIDAWLVTAAQMKKPLADVTSEMVREIEKEPNLLYPGRETVRLVGKVEPASAARIRKATMTHWTPEYVAKYPGIVEWAYTGAIADGDTAALAAMDKYVESETKERERMLRSAPLDEALAYALREDKRWGFPLPRVWARAVVEDPAFLAKMAEQVCKGVAVKNVVTPTPPTAGLKLVVTEKLRETKFECARTDVIVRVTNGEAVVEEEILEGECSGACTAAEKREGRKHIKEIEDRIERGESTESELDYNFTECQFSGHREGRMERVGDRDVAILVEIDIGPHSVEQTSYHLAFESCGKVFIGGSFGGRYAGGWRLEELKLEMTKDGREIRVRGDSEFWRGYLYRAVLPECPDTPDEVVNASDF